MKCVIYRASRVVLVVQKPLATSGDMESPYGHKESDMTEPSRAQHLMYDIIYIYREISISYLQSMAYQKAEISIQPYDSVTCFR